MRIGTPEPRGSQPAGHLEAGDVGQADVEDDGIDARRLGQVEGRLAGRGSLHDMVLAAEQACDEVAEARVVLYQQQVHGCRCSGDGIKGW